MPFVLLWCKAFLATQAIELPIAVALLAPAEASRVRRIGAVLLANLASHPAVWFVFPELGLGGRLTSLVVSELWAVGSELLIYRLVFPRLSWPRALVIATAANAVSALAGWLLRWP